MARGRDRRPPTMRREAAGLHAGPDLRVERVGSAWAVEVRMRDVGAAIGESTNVFEYAADGFWTPIGSYPTLPRAENARAFLAEGTHLYVGPYGTGDGPVPGRIVPFAEARDRLAEIGFCEATPAP